MNHIKFEILKKEQVAELLDCEPSTIEEKARTGELPGIKIGKSWIFPREALLQRLNEMALAPKQRPSPSAVFVKVQKGGRRSRLPDLADLKKLMEP